MSSHKTTNKIRCPRLAAHRRAGLQRLEGTRHTEHQRIARVLRRRKRLHQTQVDPGWIASARGPHWRGCAGRRFRHGHVRVQPNLPASPFAHGQGALQVGRHHHIPPFNFEDIDDELDRGSPHASQQRRADFAADFLNCRATGLIGCRARRTSASKFPGDSSLPLAD